MFCDGKCEVTKETEEGTIIIKNEVTGETRTQKICVFDAIMNSLHRQEQGQVRIQAAVESDRNEYAKNMTNLNDTVAKGFLGLLHGIKEQQQLFLKEG